MKNKNNEERLYDINDLVIGNILSCEKTNTNIMYISSPNKYIFEKTNVDGHDIYREVLSNKEVKVFSDMYDGPYVTNIEKLSNYVSNDGLVREDDLIDMQYAVNSIIEQEKKTKVKKH